MFPTNNHIQPVDRPWTPGSNLPSILLSHLWTIKIIIPFKFLLTKQFACSSDCFWLNNNNIFFHFPKPKNKNNKTSNHFSKFISVNFHFCIVVSLFFWNPVYSILIFLVNKFIQLGSLPLGYNISYSWKLLLKADFLIPMIMSITIFPACFFILGGI